MSCAKKEDDAGNWEEGMKETEKDDGREEELPHDEPRYRVCPTMYLA